VAVNVFIMGELFYLFNCRSLTKSMFALGVFSNLWVIGGVGTMLALQMLFTYLPAMNYLFTAPNRVALLGTNTGGEHHHVCCYWIGEVAQAMRNVTSRIKDLEAGWNACYGTAV